MQDSSFETRLQARNIRLAFFVPFDVNPSDLLDVMVMSQKFWGGRLNPIVPVSVEGIGKNWKQFLKHFDPDYVYYLKPLGIEQVMTIAGDFGMNPEEFDELDTEFMSLRGISSTCLLSNLKKSLTLMHASYLYNEKSILKDYFRLNYLIDDDFEIPEDLGGSHKIVPIDEQQFGSINEILCKQDVTNNCEFAMFDAYAPTFRMEDQRTRAFELIIGQEGQCSEDLLYYWNCRHYTFAKRGGMNLFVTTTQLQALMKDEFFKEILYRHAKRHARIDLLSFSLDSAELEQINSQLKKFEKAINYHIQEKPDFPFKIRDAGGFYFNYLPQRPEHAFHTTQDFLVRIPKLSFDFRASLPEHRFAIEFEITKSERYVRHEKVFPAGTKIGRIIPVAGRIDSNRRIVGFIGYDIYHQGVLKMELPNLFELVATMLSSPFFQWETNQTVYHFAKYSDGSHRMKQFLKLFDDNLEEVDGFLFDRFWSDLFFDLSTSITTEGDTITFDALVERCYYILELNYAPKGRAAERPFPPREQLIKGLRKMMQNLTEKKVFLPGYILKCPHCSSKIWYGISAVQLKVDCMGCSNTIFFKVDNPVSYKLNHLIKNNIGMRDDKGKFMPDGNLTAIKTNLHLVSQQINSFEFIPQIDIFSSINDKKPKTDLDIIALVDGKLYIGECKHDSKEFAVEGHKCLENLLEISHILKPDVLILSCTNDSSEKLKRAQQYLIHKMNEWPFPIKVLTHKVKEPEYYYLHESRYFPE